MHEERLRAALRESHPCAPERDVKTGSLDPATDPRSNVCWSTRVGDITQNGLHKHRRPNTRL